MIIKAKETASYTERAIAAQAANKLLALAIERGYTCESIDIDLQIAYDKDNWFREIVGQIEMLQSRYSLQFTGSKFVPESVRFAGYIDRAIWRRVNEAAKGKSQD